MFVFKSAHFPPEFTGVGYLQCMEWCQPRKMVTSHAVLRSCISTKLWLAGRVCSCQSDSSDWLLRHTWWKTWRHEGLHGCIGCKKQWLHFNCLLSENSSPLGSIWYEWVLRVSKIWAFSTGKHTDDSLPNLQDKSPLGHSWRFGNKVFSKDLKDRYDSKQLWSFDFGKVASCHALPPKFCVSRCIQEKCTLISVLRTWTQERILDWLILLWK